MGRPPDGTTVRTETIHVRIGESGLNALDKARGAWTRSEFIRRSVRYAVQNGMKGPEQVDW